VEAMMNKLNVIELTDWQCADSVMITSALGRRVVRDSITSRKP
jgi:hypothetical protein